MPIMYKEYLHGTKLQKLLYHISESAGFFTKEKCVESVPNCCLVNSSETKSHL